MRLLDELRRAVCVVLMSLVVRIHPQRTEDLPVWEALGRIASNGFGHPTRTIQHKRDKEMLSMMDYARAVLSRSGG